MTGTGDPVTNRAWGRWGCSVAVVVVYALAAVLVLRPLPFAGNGSLPLLADSDPAQQAWFLALTHWAITGGHLSLLVRKIYFPSGFNALDNASFPLLGVLATPVTALFGPVAAYHLLLRFAFFVSALAGYIVLRRLRISWFAAAAGGAIYGFSPYMTHNYSYLFLIFVPLPPLIFLVVYEHLRDATGSEKAGLWRPAIWRGGLLAVMAAAQFLISSEILVTTALVLASTLLVLAVGGLRHPRGLAVRIGALARLAGATAVIATPLLAYPVWFALAGPEHDTGRAGVAGGSGIDWTGILWPADHFLVAGHLPNPGPPGSPQTFGDVALIGLPLLVVVVATIVVYQRVALVRVLAALLVCAWVWALGTRLMDGAVPSRVPLPFALLAHRAIFQDVVAPRLTLYAALAVGALTAIGIDRWLRRAVLKSRGPTTVLCASAVLVGLFGLVYISPASGVGVVAIAPSPTATEGALAAVPTGSVVLAYPFPRYPDDEAMLWQAQAGFRFSLLGGYAYQQNPQQKALKASAVVRFLEQAWTTGRVSHRLSTKAAAQVPDLVDLYHVGVVMAYRSSVAGAGASSVVRLFTSLYGPPER